MGPPLIYKKQKRKTRSEMHVHKSCRGGRLRRNAAFIKTKGAVPVYKNGILAVDEIEEGQGMILEIKCIFMEKAL